MRRITINDIQHMKNQGEKIAIITAYDHPMARLADKAEFPVILVGDSLGMVLLGYDSTIPVTMEDMIHHTKAVARATNHALVVADMPFMSYQIDSNQTLKNASRLIQEGGAQTVKLEGGEVIAEEVNRIVNCGIPVMGHIGLTPQSVNIFSGYKIQGNADKEARQLIKDSKAIQDAGAYAIVLELIPAPLAQIITESLSIPTIGIGAGPHCDGQIQVINDILGLFDNFVPKHTKQYLHLNDLIAEAFKNHIGEIKTGHFPSERESFPMDPELTAQIRESLLQNLQ